MPVHEAVLLLTRLVSNVHDIYSGKEPQRYLTSLLLRFAYWCVDYLDVKYVS